MLEKWAGVRLDTQEKKDEFSVFLEDTDSACRYARVNEAHDSEWSQVDDPAYDLRYCISKILQHLACVL